MDKIKKVLNNQEENYLFPFLWMHGEPAEVIQEYVTKIYESGIRALCVEPRPHPDYLKERWWQDLTVVLEAAKEKKMKVWLFDDVHFPTGYANGAILKNHPELRKKYLKITQVDYHGPQKDAGIIVKWHAGGDRNTIITVGTEPDQLKKALHESGEKVIGVIAAKLVNYETVNTDTLVDITAFLDHGVVYWDVPEGDWRIFTLVETFCGGEAATEGYLNPIDPAATQVLIDTVYQAHYKHLSAYFGSTIVGFFTDEPRFGNIKGPDAVIGKTEMVLPWREDLLEILGEELAENPKKLLPLLLVDGTKQQSFVRYTYMNVISKLYSENFTGKLAGWCQEHGVEYIGHLIEDNNAHGRLGYGAGHYYRALKDQTMAGIDVVLHQLLPGLDSGYFKTFTSTGWDGEFFHYGLAKMGSSLGHLDPKKKGRTMVELYGAYGWSEGLNLMKWITDHMLVRGVNHFVPHAFDMAPYPDTDCPPHFYAHGNNPQYRYLHLLMNYTNRLAELLSEGTHIASSLILYHAEAEWSGEAMLFQKPAKELTQNQIDFDIVSIDMLKEVHIEKGKIYLNGEQFENLIIPYAEKLPGDFFIELKKMVTLGAAIIFINDWPNESSEGLSIENHLEAWKQNESVQVISLENLATYLRNQKMFEISLNHQDFSLRYYQYRHPEGDVYLFFNESPDLTIKNEVMLKKASHLYLYNGMTNEIRALSQTVKKHFKLHLAPQETLVILARKETLQAEILQELEEVDQQEINGKWQVSLSDANEYPKFDREFSLNELENIAKPSIYPDFSGTIRYMIDFNFNKKDSMRYFLDLGEVFEVVEVFFNEQNLGTCISKPYLFEITDFICQGKNDLTIEVTNTLGTQQKDFLSQYRVLQPSGLLGAVKILFLAAKKNK